MILLKKILTNDSLKFELDMKNQILKKTNT